MLDQAADWKWTKLAEIAKMERGRFSARPRNDPKYYGGDIPFAQTGDIARAGGKLETASYRLNEEGLAVSKKFSAGTILMAIAANVGDVAITDIDVACPDSIVGIFPAAETDRDWLFFALHWQKANIASLASQNAQANLNLEKLNGVRLPLPPLPEQRRIAAILRRWDEAIDAASRLIDAKRRRLDAITFRLVFGGARLANFGDAEARREARCFNVPAAWRVAKIGDVAKEISRINADSAVSEVLSCSKHDGFVRSLEYFKKQVFSADLGGYKVIARGDFGFPSNHVEEGSIGLQNIVDIGVVSPIYCIFRFDPKEIDADYAFRVLKTSVFRHMFSVATSASVDRRGSLRWKEFRKLPFPVPPLAEQQAIAAAVDLAAQDLAASRTYLDAFKRQKRGLMQKLLTGEWRVPA